MIIISDHVQECIYMQLLYVQMEQLCVYILICYWLLTVQYIIGWAYFNCDIGLWILCNDGYSNANVHVPIILLHPPSCNIVQYSYCVTV